MTETKSAELTVIVVSYNTRDLTLKCLETLFENTQLKNFRTVVWDNDSHDGSAEAIEARFPQVDLIHSRENVGFAKANNLVAETATSEWLLLLNPDTEVYPNAIDELLEFSKENTKAGITGGRTVFPDGSLNIASCWKKISPWSAFCHAVGLTTVFPNRPFFNPEAMIDWERDSIRQVDIVVGCFLMIPTKLWHELGGFDLKYVMYGEEADLCLRAAEAGYQPMITPKAEIMHLVGASSSRKADKLKLVAQSRVTLIKDHWWKPLVPLGLLLMFVWVFSRFAAVKFLKPRNSASYETWTEMWSCKKEWLNGYSS
ncbi:MAG: glycosyltransferase family 2 protein [Sneathiellales bacterium]|nr:glycosyltransferase family 2 protein [Sneathiellales bacterium]